MTIKKNLDILTPEELGKLFPIILSTPVPDWTDLYTAEKKILEKRIGRNNIFKIEHIGSTAIPGILAKPTIDIILGIEKNSVIEEKIIAIMKEIGYYYIPKPENPPPHMLFAKGYTEEGFKGQAYHVHVRYPGKWEEVYFRDYLILHPEAKQEYEELKQKLAVQFKNDRDSYTEGKTEFVKKILILAKNDCSEFQSL